MNFLYRKKSEFLSLFLIYFHFSFPLYLLYQSTYNKRKHLFNESHHSHIYTIHPNSSGINLATPIPLPNMTKISKFKIMHINDLSHNKCRAHNSIKPNPQGPSQLEGEVSYADYESSKSKPSKLTTVKTSPHSTK